MQYLKYDTKSQHNYRFSVHNTVYGFQSLTYMPDSEMQARGRITCTDRREAASQLQAGSHMQAGASIRGCLVI